MRNMRCAEYYFGDADVILIAFDISLVLDQQKIDTTSQFVLEQVTQQHNYTVDPYVIPPQIIHVFTKQDRIIPAVRKRNQKTLRNLAKNGVIGNFLFVSTKTGEGMSELKQAIFNFDLKGQGEKVFPQEMQKKTKGKVISPRKSFAPVKPMDSDGEEKQEMDVRGAAELITLSGNG